MLALGISAVVALPLGAQNRQNDRPPKQERQQQRQEQRQERRQQQQEGRRAQMERRNPEPPRHAQPPRSSIPSNRPTESMNTLNGGNRPPNARAESEPRPNFNSNRPPNASSSQANPKRFQDLSPEQQRKVLENNRRLQKLTPAEHLELHKREEIWGRLTPEQKNHIKGNILPRWQQMPPDRQRAIRQRLGVLQNMPESARNQHLNDPNFTRGMSEEDKAMLRDLSHMHVGAPDPPNE